MDAFGCDYGCRTVGEAILKYSIPDDWLTGFDIYDEAYPVITFPVRCIRKASAIMALHLRMVENESNEYAGCMVITEEKTIFFKIDYVLDFINALRDTILEENVKAQESSCYATENVL